jgi:hypothetical protein
VIAITAVADTNIRWLVGHISDRPQKRASPTFGIRRGDCGLGDGVPSRSHLSLRAIARPFRGTLDALAAWDYAFALAIQALLPAGRAAPRLGCALIATSVRFFAFNFFIIFRT